ncbi:MAG TPA: IS1595 family transposase [Caulobacteraceae bacterium]|nr:IS1595 family transposase [Caulobacteraceae bacterium]
MPARKPKTDLANPIYNDDDAARAHLERLLWPHGPVCPRCGVVGNAVLLKGKSTRPGVYKCREKACRKPFTVTVNTVMERSKIPLHKWVLAAHFMASSKKGMSALQLMRMMGVTYETAWFLFHRLREAAREVSPGPLGGEGVYVEADETAVGGKERNKRLSKRNPKNIGSVGKSVAFTLVERGGRARSFHVANVSGKTLAPIIFKNVRRTSTLMTDDAGQYRPIGEEFARHESVNHGIEEYVRGDAHSNTVEGFFSIFKCGVIGTFHSVSEAHLHRYLAEFDFRYNTREALGVTDDERAAELLRGASGKRLYYRNPAQASHA